MGILLHLCVAAVHLALVVVDLTIPLLLARFARRWSPTGWIATLDTAGQPLLAQMLGFIDRQLERGGLYGVSKIRRAAMCLIGCAVVWTVLGFLGRVLHG